MLLPRWFPFHLDRISYWSRTVLVPLLVLMARRPRARNPRGVHIRELFVTNPEDIKDWIRGPYRSGWGHFFRHVDWAVRRMTPFFPKQRVARAERAAVDFVLERLNGEDGLGAIYPAMANSVMMLDTLGYAPDHEAAETAWRSVRNLLVVREDEAYCQPCLSPIWDTALAGHAMAEAEGAGSDPIATASAWLRERQVLDVVGDWARNRPGVAPGGWAFQYANPHYPDVDDTAAVGMLLHRHSEAGLGGAVNDEAVARAREWVIGMQGGDGGWGAFDADNHHHYLNHIPFADHGALLDPSTADVTARCVSFLAQTGMRAEDPVDRPRPRLAAARAGAGRKLVRPLGHQLPVRDVVGAVRAERGRGAAGGSGDAPGGRVPARDAAGRRRLGRGQRELRRRRARPLLPQQPVADRLGAARPDGRRRGGPPGDRARRVVAGLGAGRGRAMGGAAISPRWVSRACSTSATTATGCSSRCSRWRATAT